MLTYEDEPADKDTLAYNRWWKAKNNKELKRGPSIKNQAFYLANLPPRPLKPWEQIDPVIQHTESKTEIELELLRHQQEFVDDTTTREIALVGGFGCGKTEALIYKALTLSALCAGNLKDDGIGLLIEPNDTQVRQLLRPRFESICNQLEIPFTVKNSPRLIYTLEFEAGDVPILMMPAGSGADSFRGFQCAFVGVDEADTLDSDTLWDLWISLSSRMRGCIDVNYQHYQLFATTTPEGYGFCYQNWVSDLDERPELSVSRKLIKGKTKWNPFLPSDYISNLEARYPKNLLASYLEGEFVNLEGNIVYVEFDRNLNTTDRTLSDFAPNAILHIGVDFNNNKTCGVVNVIEGGLVYTVDEMTSQKNTRALCEEIHSRFPGRMIYIYPDASGRQHTANADQSNIQILKEAGFQVYAHAKNPRVSNRVASANAMFCNAKNERRWFVNIKKCPVLVKSLEQQKYKNGEPEKKNDIDHCPDAQTYMIWYRFPITGNNTGVVYR